MQYLAEKTRQALGLGDRDFRPTSLEAEHRALQEASVYGNHLHTLERSLAKWSATTDELLRAAGRFLTEGPRPRHFTQWDPSDPTTLTASPPELPPEFERLNQPSMLRRLAAGTPLVVGDMVRLGLADPMALWLAALDAAKERLSRLEHLRIRYDAARRVLHSAARAPGADELGDPAHLHLIQLEAENEPVMSEFRDAYEALGRHLQWLVDEAARLKAAVVSELQEVNSAALKGALLPPEGLLLVFPRDLLERPETIRAAAAAIAAHPASPAAAAAMTEAAVEAATAAAIAASGLDVPPPQLVMLGPEAPGGVGAGGATDVVMVVPPGTAGVATDAAVQAAAAAGMAAAQDSALSAPRELKQYERMEERLLQSSATGGPAAARLYKLATRPDRRAAVQNAWQVLVQRAMYSERHKTLAEHAEEQMRDVKERAGMTGGFLMKPEAAPEYILAGRRRLPGGGPLQFLKDTLLGPPQEQEERQHQQQRRGRPTSPSVGATSGVGGSGGRTVPPASSPSAAAAAREQREEVAAGGAGGGGVGAPGGALTPPTDTGVGGVTAEAMTGPRRDEQPAAVGAGGGGGTGVAAAVVAEPLTRGHYAAPPLTGEAAAAPARLGAAAAAVPPRGGEGLPGDLAPPVPLPTETYTGSGARRYSGEMPAAAASTSTTASHAAERAAVAMVAADTAMDVSAASMDAATASMEAAAAAIAAAAAAQEAATDAAVAAIEMETVEEAETPSTPPRRSDAGSRGGGMADFSREYGGPSPPTAELATGGGSSGGGNTAPRMYEELVGKDLTSFGLAAEGAAAAAAPPESTIAAMTARTPPTRLPEVPAKAGPEAVSEQLGGMHLESFGLEPTTTVGAPPPGGGEEEGEKAGAMEAAPAAGGGGVQGVFGALKAMVEEAGAEGGVLRGGVAAEPSGPAVGGV